MWIFVVAALVASPCPDAVPPVPGSVIEGFAPIGDYAGHWGVDFAAEPASEVGAVADGVVLFAGSVAGRLSVSVDHGRGMVTTVSYLASVAASRGERVRQGETLGMSGLAHDTESVHVSLRVADEYTDPMVLFSCRVGDVSEALRLVPVPD
jgi:murein DD-endopeptidase MepM/ murein hydrolase activator NlpD